jgi:hypothetical protein
MLVLLSNGPVSRTCLSRAQSSLTPVQSVIQCERIFHEVVECRAAAGPGDTYTSSRHTCRTSGSLLKNVHEALQMHDPVGDVLAAQGTNTVQHSVSDNCCLPVYSLLSDSNACRQKMTRLPHHSGALVGQRYQHKEPA